MPLARLEPHTPWPQRPRCLATRQCTSARPCRWRAQRSPRPARRPPWPKCLDSPEGRPVQGPGVSCKDSMLLEHRLQPGRHQRCLPKSTSSPKGGLPAHQLGAERGASPHPPREAGTLCWLGPAQAAALAFAKPEPLGISRRKAHLGVLVVIDYECTRSHDARPLRRAVSGAGKEQLACGRSISIHSVR